MLCRSRHDQRCTGLGETFLEVRARDLVGSTCLRCDYKLFTNFTSDGPNDWDIAIGILYPSYAAMDQLDAKGATVVVKHYGSREAMFDAAKKRAEIRDVVASKVAREVTPK